MPRIPRSGLSDTWRAIFLYLTYDLAAAWLSMQAAFMILETQPSGQRSNLSQQLSLELVLALAVALVVTKVYRQVWRHTNASDLRRIGQAALLANLIVLPLAMIFHEMERLSIWLLLIELPFLIALMVGGRLVSRSRATGQWLSAFRRARSDLPYAIIVGDGTHVADTIATLSQSEDGLPVRPLGIIELGDVFTGRAIGGVQVLGNLNKLDHFLSVLTARLGETPWIALAGRLSNRDDMDTILDVSSRYGATIQRLRRTGDSFVEPVRFNDLLPRPERKLDERLVSELIANSRVFVTGAGGTIGSELVKQCAALGPSEITLFDSGEYNLYEIDLYLKNNYPNTGRRTFLGNVRDKARVEEAMKIVRPDVVIHAAALKHVPLMEMNPNEAVLTNLDGARNVAQAAADAKAGAFVFISTDKAVHPVNVMGATKRAAELYLQALAPHHPHTSFAMVRFGNVLGSAGSVAPLFERQIKEGGPVTVTHQDMTRYFMSVEEASCLVLQSAALAKRERRGQASLFVLDMGEPVKILELARRMIRLNGLRPGKDIAISFTGLRPGEKLNESVFYGDEEVQETHVEGVLRVNAPAQSFAELNATIDRLVEAARTRDRKVVQRFLMRLAPELQGDAQKDAQDPDKSNQDDAGDRKVAQLHASISSDSDY